ncbi:MAG: hypothetical protein AB7P20_11565 [Rhizobiaceae bacterium]
MSQSNEAFLRQTTVGIDIDAWNQLVAGMPRRARRSVETRLAAASRTLSSLRVSERSERRMLQVARERLQISTQRDPDRHPSADTAELVLEVETHLANLTVIEHQIAMVRLAIEHLHRRSVGWSGRSGNQAEPSTSSEKAERGNDHMQRGFEAVRAIRAWRAAANHSARANV